jgi:hypothetical protein
MKEGKILRTRTGKWKGERKWERRKDERERERSERGERSR